MTEERLTPLVALDAFPPARRSLLMALKRLGEATAEELADVLLITPSAVRQQLASASEEGLVIHRQEQAGLRGPNAVAGLRGPNAMAGLRGPNAVAGLRGPNAIAGRGRPRHVYSLSHSGHRLFPAGYGALATDVLDYVNDIDPALVDEVFERRRQHRVERVRERLAPLAFDDRIPELARVLDEDGYLAEAIPQPDGSWRVVERNCAIFAVARRYGQACSSELGFLREVIPGADIERVSHMVAGGRMCAYEIRPRALAST